MRLLVKDSFCGAKMQGTVSTPSSIRMRYSLVSVKDDVVVVLGEDQQRFDETDGKDARPDSLVFPFGDLSVVLGPEEFDRNVATWNTHG